MTGPRKSAVHNPRSCNRQGVGYNLDGPRSAQITARPSTPSITSGPVAGSGTTTAMPTGLLNPETKEAFTVAPEVVYSPIVPLP